MFVYMNTRNKIVWVHYRNTARVTEEQVLMEQLKACKNEDSERNRLYCSSRLWYCTLLSHYSYFKGYINLSP